MSNTIEFRGVPKEPGIWLMKKTIKWPGLNTDTALNFQEQPGLQYNPSMGPQRGVLLMVIDNIEE